MAPINWTAEILDTIISLSGKYGRWLNARGKELALLFGHFVRYTGQSEILGWDYTLKLCFACSQ